MDPREIDRIVCAWSMKHGIAMSDEALNALVDALSLASAPYPHPTPKDVQG